jgi:hypothetical protein
MLHNKHGRVVNAHRSVYLQVSPQYRYTTTTNTIVARKLTMPNNGANSDPGVTEVDHRNLIGGKNKPQTPLSTMLLGLCLSLYEQ